MKKALLAAALLLGGLELALRALGYYAPGWHQLDLQLGWTLRANKYGVINSAGFHDAERFLDKPDGVYRIAVVGDERSEALDTPFQRTWWGRLPARMEACGFQRPVETLNFGVGAYSSAQEYVMLETAALRYAPDLVLLQFSPDDVAQNSFSLAKDKLRPFFILDARGVARIDESFSFDPSFDRFMQTRYRLGVEVVEHSRAYQLVRQLIPASHPERTLLSAPPDRLWEDAWRVTEQILAKANEQARRNGARMALVVVPDAAQEGPAYPEERLAALGRREGFEVIALAGAVRGRWTADAQRAATEVIAGRLCGAAPPQPSGE